MNAKDYADDSGWLVNNEADFAAAKQELRGAGIVARWESKSGKWYAQLDRFATGGYGYTGNGCGGVLYADDDDDAIAQLEARIATGVFQPDANTTPLARVV